MKFVVLADNEASRSDLRAEHGLSIYVESGVHKVLLDTGASDVFIRNAEKLRVRLDEVDYVFISHGHADHIGGLTAFLDINRHAKVIMSARIPGQNYFSERKGWHSITSSIDYERYRSRILFVEDELHIDDDIHVYRNESATYPTPAGNKHLFRHDLEDRPKSDDFNHELIFTIGTDRLLVYTGCAHSGLLNILETVCAKQSLPLSYVVGGFHLVMPADDDTYESAPDVHRLGTTLRSLYPDTQFYTGHCTSGRACAILSDILPDQIAKFHIGFTITE